MYRSAADDIQADRMTDSVLPSLEFLNLSTFASSISFFLNFHLKLNKFLMELVGRPVDLLDIVEIWRNFPLHRPGAFNGFVVFLASRDMRTHCKPSWSMKAAVPQ
jgi:hypothetical protein